MGQTLILETSFLIDLEREHQREAPGRATAFLETRDDARLYLPFVVAGELASGASLSQRQEWESFLAPFYVLPPNADVSWHYGQTFRHLRNGGQMIGTNDLWIAATALAYRMPVVTRNEEHFRRVPHLEVQSY